MTLAFNEAGVARSESVRASNEADRQMTIDVSLLGDYVAAVGNGDGELAEFIAERFPDHLAVASEAWLATDPLVTPDAPPTPFDMDEYRLEDAEEADRLVREAEARKQEARQAGDNSDDFTLTSVLLAVVILFAALSTKTADRRLQRILLGLALAVFAATAGVIATFPAII